MKIGDGNEFYERDNILVEKVSVTYSQHPDCTEDSEDYQTIVIESRDGGGGSFPNIKTESWSFSDIKEFAALLDDFNKRLQIVTEYNEKSDSNNSETVGQDSNS